MNLGNWRILRTSIIGLLPTESSVILAITGYSAFRNGSAREGLCIGRDGGYLLLLLGVAAVASEAGDEYLPTIRAI